jgi:hypothetical protein
MTTGADDAARLEHLQANAHLPEVQEEIRRGIRLGTIRVVPMPGGGIRIIPLASDPGDGGRPRR